VSGPLAGVRVVEMTSAAPAPFACMMLADMGAEVLRVDRGDRVGRPPLRPVDPLARSRHGPASFSVRNTAFAFCPKRSPLRVDPFSRGPRPTQPRRYDAFDRKEPQS
jgi:alpha-methylacyl-CoA racemase